MSITHDPRRRRSVLGAVLGVGGLALALAACGLDESAKISSLSEAERRELCLASEAARGGVTEADCSGVPFRFPTVEVCVERALASDCTVAAQRACDDSLGGDACQILSPPCLALLSCVRTSTRG